MYATLPIGMKIPSHTLEFRDSAHAFAYLTAYLDIHEKWFLKPPEGVKPSQYLEACICVLGAARSDLK